MYAGLRRFRGRKPLPLPYYLALGFIYAAGFFAFTYLDPNVIIRIVIISGLTAPVSLLCGLVLVIDIPRELKTEHVIASAPFFAYAAHAVFRIFWTVGGRSDEQLSGGRRRTGTRVCRVDFPDSALDV